MPTPIPLSTAEGSMPTHIFTPPTPPPWPPVLFFMDGFAPRPGLFEMATRLAASGYLVLLPDLYFRVRGYAVGVLRTLGATPEGRAELRQRYILPATHPHAVEVVARALFQHLDGRADVRHGEVGTTGYCMGGGVSLRVAGLFPQRVAAAASFHGGWLATEAPDSPHWQLQHARAEVYVAAAEDDPSFTADIQQRLERSLKEAGLVYRVEVYPEARHGFAIPDLPVYQPAAAARHWRELLDLLERRVKRVHG